MTNVEQQGPEGPWTGEITNSGDQTIHSPIAYARIYDADGFDLYANVGAITCPSRLLPGERGAFELFAYDPSYPPLFKPGTPTPPLRAEFFPPDPGLVGTGQARGDGLLVREIERDVPAKRVRVALTNNSGELYSQFTVCAVLRDAEGKLLEVARADGPHLPFALFPGETYELDLFFHSLPDGELRYHALGLWSAPYTDCCPVNGPSTWVSVNNQEFSVLLPPGWAYEPRQGIDSFVGAYVGDGVELTFDYGIYSDPLSFEGDPSYDVHEETIGGVTAKIVRAKGASGITGVHFARIEKFAFPGDNIAFDVRLTIVGRDLTPEQLEIAMQVFRSIRFAQ